MTRVLFLLSLLTLNASAYAQKTDTAKLKISAFNETRDCFVVTALDANSDTVTIISLKDSAAVDQSRYDKMTANNFYDFILLDMRAEGDVRDENFELRVGETLILKGNSKKVRYPMLSINSKGDAIIRKVADKPEGDN